MNYIAIDLWNKRVWVAIARQNIAFAHSTVARPLIVSHLKKIISTEQVTHIIIWLPYDLYGIDTRQLEKTQKFIQKLTLILPDIIIIWHDERFSSFQASDWFSDHRDDIAAQCILQSYLDTQSNS